VHLCVLAGLVLCVSGCFWVLLCLRLTIFYTWRCRCSLACAIKLLAWLLAKGSSNFSHVCGWFFSFFFYFPTHTHLNTHLCVCVCVCDDRKCFLLAKLSGWLVFWLLPVSSKSAKAQTSEVDATGAIYPYIYTHLNAHKYIRIGKQLVQQSCCFMNLHCVGSLTPLKLLNWNHWKNAVNKL